jgi:L,D-peptidoglycan transpeptidase YkuD (ErfK/YbiS/YcfS/YnhG family)
MLAAVLTVPAITPSQDSASIVAGASSSSGATPAPGTSRAAVPGHRGPGSSPAATFPGAAQPSDPGASGADRPANDGAAGARGRLNLSTVPAARTPKGPLGSPAIQKLLAREVPAGSRQAVLVTGEGETSKQLVALSRWERGPQGWYRSGEPTRAHIGAQGWGKQRAGDYRSPIGTYTLTAAGGYLPAPKGTKLPYDYRPERYLKPGSRFADYVVRINWNVARSDWDHVPADTPSIDWNRGSGIWLHADSRYDTATAGCISQPLDEMARTLQWLDPSARPVIVLAPGPLLVDRPW